MRLISLKYLNFAKQTLLAILSTMKEGRKKITVVGGGTGTSIVLAGLKKNKVFDLSAVVVVSDNGGSTGRLRDEFGFLPVGDLRQCLAALTDGDLQREISKILLYRFEKGRGLKGHNLGNLILTALEDLYPSPGQALEIATQIFRINGQVYPITEADVQLKIQYQNGETKHGEKTLDDPKNGGKKIDSIDLQPPATIYSKAAATLEEADGVIMGPGDLYASLLPNTLVDGFSEALQKNKKRGGKFIFILNLMTHFSQTHQMTAQDHINEVEKYCKRQPDIVIINNAVISPKIQKLYAANQEYPVIDDLGNNSKKSAMTILRQDLLSEVLIEQKNNDEVPRSLLRHDRRKLRSIIEKIIIK